MPGNELLRSMRLSCVSSASLSEMKSETGSGTSSKRHNETSSDALNPPASVSRVFCTFSAVLRFRSSSIRTAADKGKGVHGEQGNGLFDPVFKNPKIILLEVGNQFPGAILDRDRHNHQRHASCEFARGNPVGFQRGRLACALGGGSCAREIANAAPASPAAKTSGHQFSWTIHWGPITIRFSVGRLSLPRILMSPAPHPTRDQDRSRRRLYNADSSHPFHSLRHGACRGPGLRRAAGPDPRAGEPGQPVCHGARQA